MPRGPRAARALRLAAALSAVLATLAAAGCGGGDEDRAAPPPPRTATSPAAPTPSDAPRPARGAPVVAALGDSITAGTPLWDPDPEIRDQNPDALNPQSQWSYWAQAGLRGRLRFRNCGVPGETTEEIAARLPRCARGAEVVVVQGGVNDLANGASPAEPAANLRALVRRAKAGGRTVLLAEVLPWNAGYPDFAAPIDALNREIARIGREEGVPVLQWHDALEDPRRPGRMRAALTIEGTHPSVPGYRRLGEIVAARPELRRLAAEAGPQG